jgi:rubrerythrin
VAVGSFIGDHIPLRYIKIAAGVVFIIFGSLYLKDAFVPEKEAPEPKTATFQFIGDSIIKAALAFEEQELKMLHTIRETVERSDCLSVVGDLILEEEEHLRSLSRMKKTDSTLKKEDHEQLNHLNEEYACSEDDMQIMQDLYNREAAMAEFYRLMSSKTKIAGVKEGLYSLYLEELDHCERIRPLLSDHAG